MRGLRKLTAWGADDAYRLLRLRPTMGLMLDLGRPFFLQAAEEVFGLKLTDGGQDADGAKTPMVGPVRTLQ